jgi:hypothetical protein
LIVLNDNAYVTNCAYSSAYVLMLLKEGALIATILINSAYVTNCAHLGAYVLIMLKDGAFITNNVYLGCY